MQTVRLKPFDDQPSPVSDLNALYARRHENLYVEFRLEADMLRVALPGGHGGHERPLVERRVEGLWKHSCFELFVRPSDAEEYVEVNLSQAGEWAVYEFDGERSNMRDAPFTPQNLRTGLLGDRLAVAVHIDLPMWRDVPWQMNLTAVIEDELGDKTYWAVTHSAKGKPDFHNPDCFTLELQPTPISSPRT